MRDQRGRDRQVLRLAPLVVGVSLCLLSCARPPAVKPTPGPAPPPEPARAKPPSPPPRVMPRKAEPKGRPNLATLASAKRVKPTPAPRAVRKPSPAPPKRGDEPRAQLVKVLTPDRHPLPAKPPRPTPGPDLWRQSRSAMGAEEYGRAARLLEAAVRGKGFQPRAYYDLAVCRTELGDFAGAVDAYEHLASEAKSPLWRRLAKSRSENLKRRFGHEVLFRAECLGAAGNWEQACECLEGAIGLGLPPALDQRAREGYFRAQAEDIADGVAQAVTQWGGDELDVAPFVAGKSGLEAEATGVRRVVLKALQCRSNITARESAETDEERLRQVSLADASSWEAGEGPPEARPLLVGAVGGKGSVRLVCLNGDSPRLLHQRPFHRPGTAPPGLGDEVWDRLPVTRPSRRGFDVEVWSGAESLGADDAADVFFRVSRDSFVSVYEVRADGSMGQVFPGGLAESGFVSGARTFRLNLRRPKPTTRGVWALATLVEAPIDVRGLRGGDPAKEIGDVTQRLPEGAWVASAYRFRVVR